MPVVQKKKNNTGLPGNLKSGIENLSGIAMDDVHVHYHSEKPALVNAHAYAQGTDIHIATGQEKHLPHEAWHVVQQKQGRVKPTMQLKGTFSVNDDKGLEIEADKMGTRAMDFRGQSPSPAVQPGNYGYTGSMPTVVQRYPYELESGVNIGNKAAFEQFIENNKEDKAQLLMLMKALNRDIAATKQGMAPTLRSAEIMEGVALRRELATYLAVIEKKRIPEPMEMKSHTNLVSTLKTETGVWSCHCFLTFLKEKQEENNWDFSMRFSMSLAFQPGAEVESSADCHRVGLVQLVKREQKLSAMTILSDAEIKEGEVRGYRVDRAGEQINPLFGKRNISSSRDDTPDAERESFQVLGKKTGSWTPATLHDPFGSDVILKKRPDPKEMPVFTDVSFETSAFCIHNDGSIGRFLGSVKWGCIVYNENFQVDLFGLFPGAKGSLSTPFKASAREWNNSGRNNLIMLPEETGGQHGQKK